MGSPISEAAAFQDCYVGAALLVSEDLDKKGESSTEHSWGPLQSLEFPGIVLDLVKTSRVKAGAERGRSRDREHCPCISDQEPPNVQKGTRTITASTLTS